MKEPWEGSRLAALVVAVLVYVATTARQTGLSVRVLTALIAVFFFLSFFFIAERNAGTGQTCYAIGGGNEGRGERRRQDGPKNLLPCIKRRIKLKQIMMAL